MDSNQPSNINEAIKILAYNEWAWDRPDNALEPHPKDKPTVQSLAEAQYAWTERQGKLAIVILKRYATKFRAHGIDIDPLLKSPTFEKPFRVISSAKTIEVVETTDDFFKIELRFPYNKKIVELVRCCRTKKGLPEIYFSYDGDSKTWKITKTDVTTYYMTLIAARYDFDFITPSLLDEFEEIKKEKNLFKKPRAIYDGDKITLKNVHENLEKYWTDNIANKKPLLQLDSLKNLNVDQKGIRIKAYSEVAKKIAHNSSAALWVDKTTISKDQLLLGLMELDCFPLVMTVSGDITNDKNEIKDVTDWIRRFEIQGFDPLKHIFWGFDLKEPKMYKDYTEDQKWSIMQSMKLDRYEYEQAFELYEMAKHFKRIDEHTKICFIRNKLPRTVLRSKIKFKAGLVAIGGGYYATGGEIIQRYLDNLPKKLYYSDVEPSTFRLNGATIRKL